MSDVNARLDLHDLTSRRFYLWIQVLHAAVGGHGWSRDYCRCRSRYGNATLFDLRGEKELKNGSTYSFTCSFSNDHVRLSMLPSA